MLDESEIDAAICSVSAEVHPGVIEIALFQKLRYVPWSILKRFVVEYKLGSDFY